MEAVRTAVAGEIGARLHPLEGQMQRVRGGSGDPIVGPVVKAAYHMRPAAQSPIARVLLSGDTEIPFGNRPPSITLRKTRPSNIGTLRRCGRKRWVRPGRPRIGEEQIALGIEVEVVGPLNS